MAPLGLRVLQEHKDLQVLPALQEPLVLPDPLDPLDLLDRQAQQAHKEQPGPPAPQARPRLLITYGPLTLILGGHL